MELPQGLERLPGDGDAVGSKVHPALVVLLWVGAVLLAGLGVLLLFVKPAGPPRPGSEIPLWAPLILIGFGVLVGLLAVVSPRGPKIVIDDEGVHSRAVFGRATIRWEPMQDVALSQPRGNAIWFTAPGGIVKGGKVTRMKRIPFNVSGLRVRPADLHAYVLGRARGRRTPAS
ncbi:hypothetical protein [Microlunatus sp. GCM10028923]|uniref:hypothetical protein n=1 Tax=Microlunatus sp. GCM10028923 TaxID=3273400 RepID=UPI0036180C16